ncbi:MAG: hypothetical protein AB1726_06140 [Planctomycetota bacterium]
MEKLATVLPPKQAIEKGVAALKAKVEPKRKAPSPELEMLRQALEVKVETGAFYQRRVKELAGDHRRRSSRGSWRSRTATRRSSKPRSTA